MIQTSLIQGPDGFLVLFSWNTWVFWGAQFGKLGWVIPPSSPRDERRESAGAWPTADVQLGVLSPLPSPRTPPQKKRPKKSLKINVTSYSDSRSPVALLEIISPFIIRSLPNSFDEWRCGKVCPPPTFNVRSLTPQFKIGVRAENPRLSPHHQGLAPLFNQFFGSLGTSDPVQPPVCQISASEKSQSLTFWESLEAHNSSRPPPICETPPPPVPELLLRSPVPPR